MKKVLVVDDMNYYRESIKDILKEYPFEIYTASNGLEAFEKYKSIKPDFVTMDIDMPIMSGLDALEKIMQFDKNAIVIMCSTLMSVPYYIEKAKKIGASGFVAKPFTRIELLEQIAYSIDMEK